MIYTLDDYEPGDTSGNPLYICPYCDGSGLVLFFLSPDEHFVYNYCRMCNGTGVVGNDVVYRLTYSEGGGIQ